MSGPFWKINESPKIYLVIWSDIPQKIDLINLTTEIIKPSKFINSNFTKL